LTTYLVHTEDGRTWSQPQPVYQPQFIVWKPCQFGQKFYSAAHKKDEASGGKGREVHLLVSEDGVDWKKISTIRAGNWESETTLYFAPTGRATAFLRQKYGSPPCQILEADAPYVVWKSRPPGVPHLSGHSVCTFRGVTYLLYDAEGGLVSNGEATVVADGQYSATLSAEQLAKLPVGSAKIEFIVSSKLVAIPTFAGFEFAVAP